VSQAQGAPCAFNNNSVPLHICRAGPPQAYAEMWCRRRSRRKQAYAEMWCRRRSRRNNFWSLRRRRRVATAFDSDSPIVYFRED